MGGKRQLFVTYSRTDTTEAVVGAYKRELELHAEDLEVVFDANTVLPGKLLSTEIEAAIAGCHAYLFVATAGSLSSEWCTNELDWARKRHRANPDFPFLVLHVGPVNLEGLPESLKHRLCVTTDDESWPARIAAATRGEVLPSRALTVGPCSLDVHQTVLGYAIEIRLIADRWGTLALRLPAPLPGEARPYLMCGRPGGPPQVSDCRAWHWLDGSELQLTLSGALDASKSAYLCCTSVPTWIRFAETSDGRQYEHHFKT